MTMPDERYRAVSQARDLLFDLCVPSVTPKVPGVVRDRARAALRHFPTIHDLDRMSEAAPEVVSKKWSVRFAEPAPQKKSGWMKNFIYGKKAK